MPDKKDGEEPVECKEAPSEEGRPLETAPGDRVIAHTDGFLLFEKDDIRKNFRRSRSWQRKN